MDDSDENIIAELESEFVELYKILKFEGLAESGASAKHATVKQYNTTMPIKPIKPSTDSQWVSCCLWLASTLASTVELLRHL